MMRALFLLCLSAACGAAGLPFFIQMSDPQFGMYTANADFAGETRDFERAIAAANLLKPAFVVVTGDLVNRPGEPAQVAEYHRITGTLDRSIRLYHVPGNHDIGNECSLERLSAWKKRHGPDHYSFRSGPLYGIVLNTVLMFAPAECTKEAAAQEAWFEKELAKAARSKAPHVLVFQHHPLFVKDASEADAYHNVPGPVRKRYLAMLEQSPVRFVFAGHLHRNAEGQSGRLTVVTTGPVGKPLGGAQSGFRVVKFGAAGIEHRYYALDEIAERIE